jgi:hypothetical protein
VRRLFLVRARRRFGEGIEKRAGAVIRRNESDRLHELLLVGGRLQNRARLRSGRVHRHFHALGNRLEQRREPLAKRVDGVGGDLPIVNQDLELHRPVDRLHLNRLAILTVFRDGHLAGLEIFDRLAIGSYDLDKDLPLLLCGEPRLEDRQNAEDCRKDRQESTHTYLLLKDRRGTVRVTGALSQLIVA